MRLAQKTIDKLPTVRLYFTPTKFYTVHYLNATTDVDVPLSLDHFKPNGRGIPWTCGVSNAILANKNLLPHPTFYVHTIGSVSYAIAMVHKGGVPPKLAIRYSHGAGPKIAAYDKSLKDSNFGVKLQEMLEASPVLHLHKGRFTGGVGSHSPGGGRTHSNPSADTNKQGLQGNAKRMADAGFLPDALVDQFDAE